MADPSIAGNPNPAEYAKAVTPHDSTNFDAPCRALYVGTGGTIVAIVAGVAITFVGVGTGTILPIRATRVNNTSTTASNIVALY